MLIPIETNEKPYIDGFKYYKKVFDMVENVENRIHKQIIFQNVLLSKYQKGMYKGVQ